MSNINPIFSIEYPNLDTLLFIRKQYPQLADMEIGTTIVDEECIITHYLPAKDEAYEVAEELIYFGTLLASTKHFHRTDDQYDLVYRCVSLAHEAEESKTVEAFSSLGEEEKIKVKMEVPSFERVNQVSVEHDRKRDILFIAYPRDKTEFSDIDFNKPDTFFETRVAINAQIGDMFKRTFGVRPIVSLSVGENNIGVYVLNITRFCLGAKTTIEDVVPNINAVVLKREHQSEPWVEAKDDKTSGKLTDEVSFVDMGHKGPYTLEEVFAKIAEQKQAKSSDEKKPFTGFKPDEVVPLQGGEHSTCTSKQFDEGVTGFIVKEVKPEKFKSLLGHVDVAYDTELDQLSITYPYDKTVFTKINVNDPEEYFSNITSISESVRTIFKLEYDFEASVRMLGIKDKIKIYVDDLSKVAERVRKVSGPFDPGIEKAIIEEVIMNVVPKVSSLVLKPQYQAKHAS